MHLSSGLIEMAKAEKADEERKAIEAGKKAIERAVAKEKEQRLKEVQRLVVWRKELRGAKAATC